MAGTALRTIHIPWICVITSIKWYLGMGVWQKLGAQEFCAPLLRNRDQVLRQVDYVHLETEYPSRVENVIPIARRSL